METQNEQPEQPITLPPDIEHPDRPEHPPVVNPGPGRPNRPRPEQPIVEQEPPAPPKPKR